MFRIRFAALLFLVTACASAASLSKTYKYWDKSPDAYFMTSAERTQWKAVQTDAEAEKFVGDYFARRGPEFQAMLQELQNNC